MTAAQRQVHVAAHFPGVNNATVWADPASGSHIDAESFLHMARSAERGLMDFFFLAEGLRLREHRGRIYDLDVMGRPDTLTILSAVAAVTEHLGLAGTLSATYHEPYELARQLATLDHLSGGRAGWNCVTTSDAFTGENFRRGGYLLHERRYDRAVDFIATARELWESWPEDPADPGPDAGAYEHVSEFFDLRGRFSVPRSPQVHPVVFQAGDSDAGREFAAGSADVVFTRHADLAIGQEFYRDVKGRLAGYGRAQDELKIYPGVSFVLGDTDDDARERARAVALQQNSDATVLAFLERVWNTDLSGYDPDGPLPAIDPVEGRPAVSQGRVDHFQGAKRRADRWRALAEAEGLSIRELVIRVSADHSFVGSPASVAEQMSTYVQERAADGFILVPHLTPGGIDEFVDRVVPELQERGVYRTAWEGATLRENLGLPAHRPAAAWAAARTARSAHGVLA
ncbi:NtaA/DmoA family FMN-dependent monooxygenase [Kocuria sp. M1R5S2]|uniref:NtaA/DmoA family FMN-dependent monooxygenase n=1 Tax=Kocuria rhizosphaerae TaxID=3376285 RepID=UPI0037B7BBF6